MRYREREVMADINSVAMHYNHGALLRAILEGVERLGKSPDTVKVEDLGPVDEFHIGGRAATKDFLDQLDIAAQDHVLDVGCGLGGASRFAAQEYGCQVTGIDLTPEYVETGAALCSWVGLDHRVTLEQGDATATPYTDGAFDKSYMLHVGMNIANKAALASELYRILRPGGRLGIYDVMRVGSGDLVFPVPWATTPEESAVASPGEYRHVLEAAGFRIVAERNRKAFALEFFGELHANAGGPPPLGLHLVMGATAPEKVKNMIDNVSEGYVAPIEFVAEKPA
jgi:ubiquinone/menaquinone biosynthesis C-methylase UbiE